MKYCQHAARTEAGISARKAITGDVGTVWSYKKKVSSESIAWADESHNHYSEIKSASDSNRARSAFIECAFSEFNGVGCDSVTNT
jgi:hypothetical protein